MRFIYNEQREWLSTQADKDRTIENSFKLSEDVDQMLGENSSLRE